MTLPWALKNQVSLGSPLLHTGMECLACLLAIWAGLRVLKLYHTSQTRTSCLLLGTGFVGAGLMDGFHMAVSSPWLADSMPSNQEALIPWTWTASRVYLSAMLYFAWMARDRSSNTGIGEGVNSALVYVGSLLLVIMFGLYFLQIPVPEAIYPTHLVKRPGEVIAAVLFLAALAGYLDSKEWKHDSFQLWLVISLAINVVIQWIYMPFSSQVHDFAFNFAHVLKILAYAGMLMATFGNAARAAPGAGANSLHPDHFSLARLNPGVVGSRLLVLIAALILFSIGSMVITHVASERRQVNDDTLNALDTIATSQKTTIEQELGDYLTELRLISSYTQIQRHLANLQTQPVPEELREYSLSKLEELLQQLVKNEPSIRNITLHDSNGRAVLSAGPLWIALVHGETLPIPRHARVLGLQKFEGENLVQLATPLQFDGRLIGAIQLWRETSHIRDLLKSARLLGKTADALVAYRNEGGGTTLLNTPRNVPATDIRGQQPDKPHSTYPMLQALDGMEGVFDKGFYDYTGQPVYAALRYIPALRLGLVVKIDTREVRQRATAFMQRSIVLGCIILGFSLIFGWIAAHLLLTPLNRMKRFAEDFGRDTDQRELHINSNDEFGLLAKTLQNAATRVTQREMALRDAEIRQRTIIETMTDGLIVVNSDGAIQFCNPAAERIFGYPFAGLNGLTLLDLIREPDLPGHEDPHDRLTRILDGSLRETGIRYDGSIVPIDVSTRQMHISGKPMYIAVVRDITQTIRYEQSLKDAEQRQRTVLDNMLDAVFIIDQSDNISYCNPAASKIFGYREQDMLRENVSMLMPEPHRTAHDQYLQNHTDTGETKIIGADRELSGQRADGSLFPLQLSVSRITAGGETMFSALIHDLTDQKEYEDALQRRNQELAEVNDELEQFAYIASHDLKTPLRAVDNLAEWIAEDLQGIQVPEDVRHNLGRLQERAKLMEQMIQELLSYSRAGRSSYGSEPVDTRRLVEKISFDLAPPQNFSIDADAALPVLNTDKPALELVLRNLISNAIKHHNREDGRITVSAHGVENEYVFEVCDDGPGIDPKYHQRIFQIFQTLAPKAKTNSTGMGLALVKRTVERYGGRIQVVPAAGQPGACFRFNWPEDRAERQDHATAEAPNDFDIAGRR